MINSKAQKFLIEIDKILKNPQDDCRLPRNTFFMDEGNVLCCERNTGESRFPYSNDGYILWAHSTGHLQAKDGVLNIFKLVHDNTEPAVEFFAGVDMGNGEFFPISILGAARQLYEPFEVKRYLVYTLSAAYYIADTDFATFTVRASVSQKSEIILSCGFINKTDKPIKVRFTTFFDAFLREGEADGIYSYKTRMARYAGNGSFIMGRPFENIALIVKRKISNAVLESSSHTVVRSAFLGSPRASVVSAKCLKTGEYCENALSDSGEIASEILMLTINDSARIDFVLPIANTQEQIPELLNCEIDPAAIDKYIEEQNKIQNERISNLSVNLYDFEENTPSANVFNNFTKKVQVQVDTCAMAKYYAGSRLGVRDVIQQLESSLHWDSKQSREKMLNVLSHITPDGRPPRQFAVPQTGSNDDSTVSADLREFIDQGNWIIACFYSYLAWTDDYSILDENIAYYDMPNTSAGTPAELFFMQITKSKKRGSVLEHLIKIMEYYEGKLDTEDGTGCMRALFGDWNDALDGLGATQDPNKQYGTGVSMMATLHYYQNLSEMIAILEKIGGYDNLKTHYIEVKEQLAKSIVEYAIDTNEKGEKRLVHGWGDHRSYKIGSFCDSDGISRISYAPNAFWVTSGLIGQTPELKPVIKDAFRSLESRFGLKTNVPAFSPETPGVGRISEILEGTLENSTAYSHAVMFSTAALYGLGDSEYAWKMLYKALSIANENTTCTPFVMANSYLDNPEYGLNGQAGLDWFTGSGTVYIKNLIRCVLGINADLNGVIIKTPRTMPCKNAEADMLIKGCVIHFKYENIKLGKRTIYLDGKALETSFDELAETETAFISDDLLHDGALITVND